MSSVTLVYGIKLPGSSLIPYALPIVQVPSGVLVSPSDCFPGPFLPTTAGHEKTFSYLPFSAL